MGTENQTGTIAFLESISVYGQLFPLEESTVTRFSALVKDAQAFERTHLPGHITGSAFIVSEDFTQTVLVHHAKLNKWLQPGGHADGDANVAGVALREAREETGLRHLKLVSPGIFDLDIHPIPARKDFPLHDHYDVRYLVLGSVHEQITVSEESNDVKWVPLKVLEKYNSEMSILRLREKLKVKK